MSASQSALLPTVGFLLIHLLLGVLLAGIHSIIQIATYLSPLWALVYVLCITQAHLFHLLALHDVVVRPT